MNNADMLLPLLPSRKGALDILESRELRLLPPREASQSRIIAWVCCQIAEKEKTDAVVT